MGARSLKVAAGHRNHTFCWREHPIVSCHAWLGATQYSVACQTHIRCTLNWTAGSRHAGRQGGREGPMKNGDGRKGAKGGSSEEAMM